MGNPKEILLSIGKDLLSELRHINYSDRKEAQALQQLFQELNGKMEK